MARRGCSRCRCYSGKQASDGTVDWYIYVHRGADDGLNGAVCVQACLRVTFAQVNGTFFAFYLNVKKKKRKIKLRETNQVITHLNNCLELCERRHFFNSKGGGLRRKRDAHLRCADAESNLYERILPATTTAGVGD